MPNGVRAVRLRSSPAFRYSGGKRAQDQRRALSWLRRSADAMAHNSVVTPVYPPSLVSKSSTAVSGPPWNRSADFEIIAVEDCGGDDSGEIRCGVRFPFGGSLLAIARRD
jgi:hypothetical protein